MALLGAKNAVIYLVSHGIALHYAEVEKLCLKWSTLTSHFSAHFCTKGAKFLTWMSELPKNPKKN
jgi:hypothetical protein